MRACAPSGPWRVSPGTRQGRGQGLGAADRELSNGWIRPVTAGPSAISPLQRAGKGSLCFLTDSNRSPSTRDASLPNARPTLMPPGARWLAHQRQAGDTRAGGGQLHLGRAVLLQNPVWVHGGQPGRPQAATGTYPRPHSYTATVEKPFTYEAASNTGTC